MTTTPEPLSDEELAQVRHYYDDHVTARLLATLDHRVAQERERAEKAEQEATDQAYARLTEWQQLRANQRTPGTVEVCVRAMPNHPEYDGKCINSGMCGWECKAENCPLHRSTP